MDVMIAIDESYLENRMTQLILLLKESLKDRTEQGRLRFNKTSAKLAEIRNILSQGIEIPVEESWSQAVAGLYIDDFVKNYPNGVIIKPKT